MAFENLFIRTKKSIGGIQLDAVISEAHDNEVTVTDNPVELGADITDHSIIKPKVVNITATVTDTPLGSAAFGEIVDTVTGLFGTSTAENLTRSVTAYNALVQLQETREPIEIQTKLKLYQNMIITRVTTAQDVNTSREVVMRITAREVLITESEIVKLQPEQLEEGSPKEQASSPEQKGRQEPITPPAETQQSVLKSVLGWIG